MLSLKIFCAVIVLLVVASFAAIGFGVGGFPEEARITADVLATITLMLGIGIVWKA